MTYLPKLSKFYNNIIKILQPKESMTLYLQ